MLLDTQKLKQFRTERGWSQEVLATVSGLSVRTVQRIESEGRTSAESALAIASAFELSPNLLQSSSDNLDAHWNWRNIMSNFIALAVIMSAISMLFILAGEAKIFFDWIGLGFLIDFTYAATIIAFGFSGFKKSITGLKYLFSKDIVGGKPAQLYASIYAKQIQFCYGGAFIAFLVGCVAIHGNIDEYQGFVLHRGYSVNLLIFVYAAIFCEAILRPLKTKFETCDIAE